MPSTRSRSVRRTAIVAGIALLALTGPTFRRALLPKPPPLEAKLKARLTRVQFSNVPFRKAIESVASHAGITLQVDWKAIEKFDAGPNVPVKLRLYDVTVETALRELLRNAPAADGKALTGPLTFDTRGDTLVIGTEYDVAPACNVMRLYDIRDLIEADLRYQYDIAGSETVEEGLERLEHEQGPELVDRSGIFSNGGVEPYDRRMVAAQSYVDAIEAVAERPAGLGASTYADVTHVAGFLLVRTTPAVHKCVKQAIEDLRQAGGPVKGPAVLLGILDKRGTR